MNLFEFNNSWYGHGRSPFVRAVWLVLEGVLFSSWIPGSKWRVSLLRLFGANIGQSVVIKPRTRCKLPWRLEIGDHTWIGEGAWIDNVTDVRIGSNVCISQGVYLCTGNHNWSKPAFDLELGPIIIADKVWVGAFVKVTPNTTIQEGAVVTLGSVAHGTVRAWTIHSFVSKVSNTKPRQVSNEA